MDRSCTSVTSAVPAVVAVISNGSSSSVSRKRRTSGNVGKSGEITHRIGIPFRSSNMALAMGNPLEIGGSMGKSMNIIYIIWGCSFTPCLISDGESIKQIKQTHPLASDIGDLMAELCGLNNYQFLSSILHLY